MNSKKQDSGYARSLIEASHDPLIAISIDGKITDMNEATLKVTGLTREQLTDTDFYNYLTEPKKAKKVYEAVFKQQFVVDSPLTILHKNGKQTDVLFNGSVYKNEKGEVSGCVMVARDISPQNLLSKYSLSLIEASIDPLVTIDIDGKISAMNEATVKITGLKREQLVDTDFFDYFTEPQKAREIYKKILEKKSVSDVPLTLRHTNGNLTDVLFNGSVYKDDLGNVLRVVVVARGITAQKLLSKYSLSIIEASLDPLVTINVDGKITAMNEATVKITGISREQLTNSDFFDYFTEPQKAREVYQEVFAKGSVADSPLTLRHKNGTLTDVLFNGSVYKDDRGNVQGVVIVARDVTAQKLLSQYSLSLIEASLDPLVTINIDGKITDMNEATVKITGLSREQLTNSDFFDYFTEPQKAREVYQEVFAKGSVADSPLTLRHKNGTLTDVLFNGSVYKDDRGNVLGVVIVARDVTAQKLLSQYSLSLIEASLDPLVTINIDGKITDMNEATVKITGLTREQLTNTDFFDYFTEPQKAREVYQEVFAKGSVADSPLTLRHTDGELTDVLFNGSVYKDDRGNVLGVVIVAHDVTDQNIIASELMVAKVFAELATEIAEIAKKKAEHATGVAENAVKAKQQFLSNMSHEIRTPMNAIIGFTNVVLKTKLTEKQTEFINAIKVSGDALIVLINDILDLAKVDAGKMTFEKTPFKMSNSISAMLHLFENKILEKNLKLIKEYDSRIPEVLIGDPVRLHQIILNLVSNAVKFTSKGSITVSVQLLHEDDEQATIKFSISDTGIGIEKNKINEIFDDFQQATSGTSRLYGGTGLGLAIVKQLVEPQGGTITVESEEDKGSTFSFTLNFQKTDINIELEAGIIEKTVKIEGVNVLIVEDIALNQLLMKTLMDDFGFECEIAGNGKIAIEMIEKNSYDVILMDLQMPIMNGFETTEYIRKNLGMNIPIIALTADVTTVDLEKCMAVGMNDYIAKPADERVLYSKMISLIKKSELEEAKYDEAELVEEPIKYVDLAYLNMRTKSNPVLMMQMISLYLDQTPPLIILMKQGILNEDWKSVKSAAHKMIPSFSIMGMDKDVENIARKIHDAAIELKKDDEIVELVNQLEKICNFAYKELEIEFKKLKKSKK